MYFCKFLLVEALIGLFLNVCIQGLISSATPVNPTQGPIVVTKSGKVQGINQVLSNGKKVNVFLSIPFAEPPIGKLRFQKPIPKSPWNTTYDATRSRSSCIQNNKAIQTSEDCLFLNIWQPLEDSNNRNLSVMFWIYGGGFTSGSIFFDIYNSDYLSTAGNVIIVSTNYRLNAFGFLYHGGDDGNSHDKAHGNVGLHDQLLALKWTKDNIASFGGNPNSITIFGESAGGMSVGAQVLSPLSAGLFQRAILQSGSPNSVIGSSSKEKAFEAFKHLASLLKCDTKDDQIACLRNKTADEILNPPGFNGKYMFNPIYGDEFLPMKPSEALKQGKINKVDLIFGHTKNEGSVFVLNNFIDKTRDKLMITESKARAVIFGSFQSFGLDFGLKVANFYLKGLSDADKNGLFKAVADSIGDFHLTCTTVLFGYLAAKWNKNKNSYSYMLAKGPAHRSVGKDLENVIGVTHADDLPYVFGFPLKNNTKQYYTQIDRQMSSDMIKVWTTFAKTGNVPSLGNVTWETALAKDGSNPHVRYMMLQPGYQMIQSGHHVCETFWKPYIE